MGFCLHQYFLGYALISQSKQVFTGSVDHQLAVAEQFLVGILRKCCIAECIVHGAARTIHVFGCYKNSTQACSERRPGCILFLRLHRDNGQVIIVGLGSGKGVAQIFQISDFGRCMATL